MEPESLKLSRLNKNSNVIFKTLLVILLGSFSVFKVFKFNQKFLNYKYEKDCLFKAVIINLMNFSNTILIIDFKNRLTKNNL